MPLPPDKSSTPNDSPSDELQLAQDEHDRAMAKLSPAKRDAMLDDLVSLARKKQREEQPPEDGGRLSRFKL